MPFGILNIDKPQEMTSRRAVDHIARLVKRAKAGHAGTLDPLATGVLIVCVGPATRLIPYIQEYRKVYRGRFRLGCRSDTDDITGKVQETSFEHAVARRDIESLLSRFVGRIDQVPPKFSAVHVDGRRAYELARRGQNVELASKSVEVFRIELTEFHWPDFALEIECGTGTYIRSIGRDLGEILGCGAVMTALERTQIGLFSVDDAVTLDSLTLETLPIKLLSPIQAVSNFRRYHGNTEELKMIGNGRSVSLDSDRLRGLADAPLPSHGERIAIIGQNQQLAAIAEFRAEQAVLVTKQVFARPD